MRTVIAALWIAICVFSFARQVHAQPGSARATAEALFDDARKLMSEKRFVEACDKFQKSQDIDPAVGTLLNLGDCYVQLDKMASAWSRYKEAENLAIKLKDKRVKFASDRARGVEPKISRLTIEVAAEVKSDGLEILQDSAPLKATLWGTALPVDSGTHVVSASAPGKKSFRQELQVARGEAQKIEIPPLEAEATNAVAPNPAPAPKSEPATPGPRERDSAPASASSRRTWALVAGGAGVVALGVGTVLALGAKHSYDEAKTHCRDGTDGCDAEAESISSHARKRGNIATIAFGVSVVGLTAGGILWFTAPAKRVALGPFIEPTGGGLVVRARIP